jgi:hypothetical protein
MRTAGWVVLSIVFAVLSALSASSAAAAEGTEGALLIDTDFGAATAPIEKTERVSGVLPSGWIEHSAWAKAWVTYETVEQDNATFLRVNVSRIDEGRCQFAYPLSRIDDESFFELRLTARSRQSTPVRFGIRESIAPFRFLWEERRAFGPDWKEVVLPFRLTDSSESIAFYFLLESPGEFDLLHLKLSRRTRDQYVNSLNESTLDETPRNLLRISRFPLGLQSGWSLARELSDGDAVEVVTDEKQIGPSSAPSLRISDRIATLPGALSSFESLERQIDSVNPLSGIELGSERPRVRSDIHWQLNSGPFKIPRAHETHVASLFLCGEGRVTVYILADGKSLSWRAIELSDNNKWRRLTIPFRPQLMARAHSLRLEGSGRIWIDALRVESGSKPRDYASQYSTEVSFAVANSENVLFEKDPARFQYAVSGYAEGALLKFRITNLYGETKPLPDIVLPAGFLNRGELGFDLFPSQTLGSFRIEGWVEGLDGEMLSAPGEIVVHRIREPRFWKQDAPDSPFGIHCLSTARHLRMAKSIGINWVRLHDAGGEAFSWASLESEKGKWAFQDRTIERYRLNNLMILGVLETTPDWASTMGRRRHAYFDRYYEPKDLNDFANYCRTVARRYKGVIGAFEVWDEPWLPTYWHAGYDPNWRENHGYTSGPQPAQRYSDMLQAANVALKTTLPDATVLGFCSGAGPLGERWSRELVEAGALTHCNAVSYHHFTQDLPGVANDTIETGYRQAIGPLGSKKPPVWMTEGNPLTGMLGNGLYKYTFMRSGEHISFASDRLCRYVIALLGQNVDKIFLYGMHAHGRLGILDDFRLMVCDDGSLHPSATAFSNMAWHLDGTHFRERATLPSGGTVYYFEGTGRCVAAVLPPPQGMDEKLTTGNLAVSDMYGNPYAATEDATLREILFLRTDVGGPDGLKRLKDAFHKP